MPPLITYMLTRLSIGFGLGSASATLLILFEPGAVGSGSPSQPLEWCLVIYGLGSTFAMGYLATALAMEGEE